MNRKRVTLLSLCLTPLISYSGWYLAPSNNTGSSSPFFQTASTTAAVNSPISFPEKYSQAGEPRYAYSVSVSGSLKDNLQRLLSHYHWELKWKVNDDYDLDGKISAQNLEALVGKMVKPFPLQATFYMQNRVVTITARNLS